MEELHYMSLQEIGRRIASHEVSPVELSQRLLDRIAKVDARLRSYATVMKEQALTAARAAEQEIRTGKYRGPLHGVPIAVKDLCSTKGIRTMCGTPVLKGFVPDVDATVVSKLHDAGAVLLGKLNLTEGAMAGYHPDFDVPLNPRAANRWPGLSSSGPGVATAAGLCFGAIGTDTGGSIRFPSSACGVVGLKPTYGRVSRFGVLALAESLDHVGPIARQAEASGNRRGVHGPSRFGGCLGVPSRRGADLAHIERDSSRLHDRLPRGMGGSIAQEHGLHDADESCGHPRDLPALRVLGRRPAVQHPVRREAPQ